MSKQSKISMWVGKSEPKPPEKKLPRLDIKEANKKYDTEKRSRDIVPSWKTEFKWAIYDEIKKLVFCKPCRAIYVPFTVPNRSTPNDVFNKRAKGPFVVGCSNLKHYNLTRHQETDGHKDAVRRLDAKEAKKGTSVAEKSINAMNAKVISRLRILFISAHSLAVHCRPLSDFEWQCEVDIKKGLDIGPTYRNINSCKQFMVAISEVTRIDIEKKLSDAKFVTLMSDGSSDVASIEQEIVYVHFALRGSTHCYFLGLMQCDHPNAEGIYSAIMEALPKGEKEETKKKVVAFAGDGASVNTGKKSGVITLLRDRIHPSIIMVQCMAHRVELAFKEAMKEASLFKKVYDMLDQLFKFYRIPKQAAGLTAAFKALKMQQIWPIRVGGTRWVSHTLRALQNCLRGYRAIVLHLSQAAITPSGTSGTQSKAIALLKSMRSRDVLEFAHFLCDMLAVLSQLSKTLQEREVCTYQVHEALGSTISNINKYKERPGPLMRKFSDLNGEYEGEKLTNNGTSNSTGQVKKVVDKLLESLDRRFKDVRSNVLESTKLADISSWPANHEENFGDDYVAVIVDHYSDHLELAGVDINSAEIEWTSLKKALYNNNKAVHTMKWCDINDIYLEKHPNILAVIDLILSLPAATAECERGFSQMNIMKISFRNRLKSCTMTMLLTIQLHSGSVSDFDPNAAIHQWNHHHNRRPNFMERSQKKKMTRVEAIEVAEEELEELRQEAERKAKEAALDTAEGGNDDEDDKDQQDSDYDSDWFTDLEDEADDADEVEEDFE